jgi:hypothetical protein
VGFGYSNGSPGGKVFQELSESALLLPKFSHFLQMGPSSYQFATVVCVFLNNFDEVIPLCYCCGVSKGKEFGRFSQFDKLYFYVLLNFIILVLGC